MLIKKLFFVFSIFIINSCDEDYVSSLSNVNPTASLELLTNLDDLYLGEPIEHVEIVLKVEESPSVSSLAFSVNYSPEYFQSDSISASPNESNLFYNISSNPIIDDFFAFTDSTFEINVGFTNNQDTTYTYGNGEIARLFIDGRNVKTPVNLSIDNVLSYDFDANIDDWYIEGIVIGKPIPQIYLDNFIYNEITGLISMDLIVIDLPKLTDAQISINYDNNVLAFIDESIPDPGNLISQGYDLSFVDSSQGEIIFNFNQSDGNESDFIIGGGSLVNLKFNNLSFNESNDPDLGVIGVDFGINFENAVFDICGECNNPLYSEYYLYDIGYWNQYSFSGLLFGCTDQSALNYDMNAIINNDSCMYE